MCVVGAGAGCSLLVDTSGLEDGATTDPKLEAGVGLPGDGGGTSDGGSSPTDGGGDAVAFDAGNAYAKAVLADSPIAYYPLEETSGPAAADVVGGRNGAWEGVAGLGVPGAVGRGASFDGESTRLVLPVGAFGFPGKAPYSVELWLRADTVDGQVRRIFEHASADQGGGYTLYFSKDFLLGSRGAPDGGTDGYAANTPPDVGQLRHYVLTFDGSVTRLYRDGVSGEAANALLSLASNPGGRLVFGDGVTGQFFKLRGVLDEIAIYDRALTAAQVQAHFAAR